MDEGREDQGVERGGKRALDTRSEERAYHEDIVGEYKPTTLPSGGTDEHCMTTTDWTWKIDLENTYFTESEDG